MLTTGETGETVETRFLNEDSRGKSEHLPIVVSHLSPRGTWDELDPMKLIEVEGVSFEKQGFAESSVYAITNRGNIELTVILFHSKKSNGTVFLVDIDSNSKSKILFLPPKSTKFFTLLVYDFETPEETPMNETDLIDSQTQIVETPEIGSIPFKFLFSNRRKFMISFTFHVTKIAPSFAIYNDEDNEIDENSFFVLEIVEPSSGSYAFKTVPILHVWALSSPRFFIDSKLDRKPHEISTSRHVSLLHTQTQRGKTNLSQRIWRAIHRIGGKRRFPADGGINRGNVFGPNQNEQSSPDFWNSVDSIDGVR